MRQIVTRPAIEKIIADAPSSEIISSIEDAFIFYSQNKTVVPPVGTLSFDIPPGDVHIKYGYIKGDEHYVIKIASGFYENASKNLPTGNGLNLVFNQKTGILETILMDEAHLTDVRTALAGAVCAKHLLPNQPTAIGIVGTGLQARLQLLYLKNVVDCTKIFVWGRSEDKLDAYKKEMTELGYDIETTQDADVITENCELIITATASTEAIICGPLMTGTLVIAMGADTIGKQELAFEILEDADLILLDSQSQCEDHGEIHKAFNKGLLQNKKMVEVGSFLTDPQLQIASTDNIVVDLTGIATQDIQISKFVLNKLNQ